MTELTITVTKIEAAKRQLHTSIQLWFSDGDPVSTLTLAHAAHEVIDKLYRKKGLDDLLFDPLVIYEEYHAEWRRLIKTAPNFVKHADREGADATVSFHPMNVEMFITMSIVALGRMNEPQSDESRTFMCWLLLEHPTWFKNPEPIREDVGVAREKLRAMSKPDFFRFYMRLLKGNSKNA